MLTVFTPTYNRAEKLNRLFDSLCSQTCCDFEWLIIDDGSVDLTNEVVKAFSDNAEFPVRYVYKENGGKHTAYNLALELACGDWFLCVDSDDMLAENAVEIILNSVQKTNTNTGFVAYKSDFSGRLLSEVFPEGLARTQMHRLSMEHGCSGEFSLVFNTDFARQFLFPVFPGERFVTENVIYDRMDQHGEMKLLPEVITICEYQADGYSQNANSVMKNNPTGYCLYFLQRIDLQTSLLQRMIHAGKYWSFRWISGNRELTYKGKHRLLVALAVIPGAVFRLYYKMFRGI